MIPELSTDHLPAGRHACTLGEVESRFVTSERFSESDTRRDLFAGLVRYLTDWEALQEYFALDGTFLRSIWIAGSFASAELHPRDLDISPIVDTGLMDSCKGVVGSGNFKKLLGHRPKIAESYGLDVFPIHWHPVVNILNENTWDNGHRTYVTTRGKFDDFWQRCRVDGSDVPSEQSCVSRRGYLEVRL